MVVQETRMDEHSISLVAVPAVGKPGLAAKSIVPEEVPGMVVLPASDLDTAVLGTSEPHMVAVLEEPDTALAVLGTETALGVDSASAAAVSALVERARSTRKKRRRMLGRHAPRA